MDTKTTYILSRFFVLIALNEEPPPPPTPFQDAPSCSAFNLIEQPTVDVPSSCDDELDAFLASTESIFGEKKEEEEETPLVDKKESKETANNEKEGENKSENDKKKWEKENELKKRCEEQEKGEKEKSNHQDTDDEAEIWANKLLAGASSLPLLPLLSSELYSKYLSGADPNVVLSNCSMESAGSVANMEQSEEEEEEKRSRSSSVELLEEQPTGKKEREKETIFGMSAQKRRCSDPHCSATCRWDGNNENFYCCKHVWQVSCKHVVTDLLPPNQSWTVNALQKLGQSRLKQTTYNAWHKKMLCKSFFQYFLRPLYASDQHEHVRLFVLEIMFLLLTSKERPLYETKENVDRVNELLRDFARFAGENWSLGFA